MGSNITLYDVIFLHHVLLRVSILVPNSLWQKLMRRKILDLVARLRGKLIFFIQTVAVPWMGMSIYVLNLIIFLTINFDHKPQDCT